MKALTRAATFQLLGMCKKNWIMRITRAEYILYHVAYEGGRESQRPQDTRMVEARHITFSLSLTNTVQQGPFFGFTGISKIIPLIYLLFQEPWLNTLCMKNYR